MKKIQKKSWTWRSLYSWCKFLLICINLNFDFPVVFMMYFQNYFANRSIKFESFTSHLKYSRPFCIRNATLAFGLSFYIRFNMAVHVVNRSSRCPRSVDNHACYKTRQGIKMLNTNANDLHQTHEEKFACYDCVYVLRTGIKFWQTYKQVLEQAVNNLYQAWWDCWLRVII